MSAVTFDDAMDRVMVVVNFLSMAAGRMPNDPLDLTPVVSFTFVGSQHQELAVSADLSSAKLSSVSTAPISMSDQEFVDAFLACRLPAAQFQHRGHLRIAWLLLQRHPLELAIEEICNGIARLAAHLGAPGKYHRTLSEALVRLMAHDGAATLSWDEFLSANPELLTDVRGTVGRYYSSELLDSARARISFVEPDRMPLPACHS